MTKRTNQNYIAIELRRTVLALDSTGTRNVGQPQMTTQPTISIAMATFNGERYLQQQLDSIASQTSLPDELVIGDDCSADDTTSIIEAFACRSPFPVRLVRNEQRLGYGENFLRTAARCSSEWITFCDQDDVWLPEKLDRVRAAILAGPPDLILAVHQAEVVDSSLVLTGRRLLDHIAAEVVGRRHHHCLWFAYGIALTVRAKIFQDLNWRSRPEDQYRAPVKMSHDVWASLMANALGSTIFIADPCMLYRRHDQATTRAWTTEGPRTRRARAEMFFRDASFHLHVARYLDELAEASGAEYRTALKEHAEDIRFSSKIMRNRALLESEQRIGRRATALLENIRAGGYNRANNFGFGLRSLVMDVAKVSGIL